MANQRIPKVIAQCRCKKIVLEIYELDPGFTACHCSTCQFMHSGPGFGGSCNNVKIAQGAEFAKKYNPSAWATWHFCGNCGTRLHYEFDKKLWKNKHNRFVVSVGLLYEAGVKNFKMIEEVSYDEKPPYYYFAGQRPKLTTSQTYALYAFDSQQP